MAAPRAQGNEALPLPDGRGSVTAPAPKRLAKNLFLMAGEFTAKLLTFATVSYLACTLGPRDYGFIEFMLPFLSLCSMAALGVLILFLPNRTG